MLGRKKIPPLEPEVSRVLRPRVAARANYDRLSRWYDWVSAPFERQARECGLKLLAVKAGERVLEIGLGTGWGLLALAEFVGPQGKAYGIDPSSGMLEIARRRCREARATELLQGDGMRLPFAAGFIDAIFMSFTLELFDTPEIPVVVRECMRMLRAGGRIGVVSLSKSLHPGMLERAYERLHAAFPITFDCRPIQVASSLISGGFESVAERASTLWGIPVAIVVATKSTTR